MAGTATVAWMRDEGQLLLGFGIGASAAVGTRGANGTRVCVPIATRRRDWRAGTAALFDLV